MLFKLQRKTLIPAQVVGYAITLLVGAAVVLLAVQLYGDMKKLLTHQTEVFKGHTVTVSKNVTLFKTANKEAVYFDEKELEDLEKQEFVKSVSRFNSSLFNVSAYINLGDGHRFSTDLFFESVPDGSLDVESDAWHWDSTSDFLPIIIPEEYLQLYNFGFAESQSMPVISQSTVQQISFNIVVEGNGKRKTFTSRIVGFSGKINSILVPDDFLQWANAVYGTPVVTSTVKGETGTESAVRQPSRLLVEFNDASDERIPAFFEQKGLNINKTELENSKMVFLFRFALVFVFVIAAIIIVLSMAFIILSINLIVQKNKGLFVNLYNIGYPTSRIASFYQWVVSVITVADIAVAAVAALVVRGLYVEKLSAVFHIDGGTAPIILAAAVLAAIMLVVYNLLIRRIIRNSCRNV